MRVVVVSDRALSCLGLVAAMDRLPEVRVVAEVRRLDEAFEYCGQDEADAVLADATVVTGGAPAGDDREPILTDRPVAAVPSDGWTPWQVPAESIMDLSVREREVFFLLGKGMSNRHIGRRLGVTERTVKTHVGRILAKLGVESRLQAGLAAFVHSLRRPSAAGAPQENSRGNPVGLRSQAAV